MAVDCCKLVGQFPIEEFSINGCVISIEHSSSTEVAKAGEEIIIGATTGTITVTGYANDLVYVGCPGKASVQVNWLRRYDCDTDTVYFIWGGAGKSSVYGGEGGIDGYLAVNNTGGGYYGSFAFISEGIDEISAYNIIRADSSSGPSSLYTETSQQDGYGLIYNGGPFAFDTETEDGSTFVNHGVGTGPWYLQSFNVDLNPGTIPRATYNFMFTAKDDSVHCT
jgi:hypothetical protein